MSIKNKYEAMFVPGALKVPDILYKKQAFCAASSFEGPKEVLADFYVTPIENQGSKPWCAAYAATTYAESILWRKNGYHKDIDPAPIYRHCKTIDGDPNGDGTTITAAMEALLSKGIFDRAICKVKSFGGNVFGVSSAINTLKYAIHKYGVVEIGCNIDTSWYTPKNGVIQGGGQCLGGHAIVACGYTQGGFLIANSWGPSWGHDGKAFIPNNVFEKQFIYAALLTHALDGLE